MRKAQDETLHGYYVYIYLDPRKPGYFKYQDLEFEFEPFYVGKGQRKRYKAHALPFALKQQYSLHKISILKKIIEANIDPIDFVLIVEDGLSEIEAYSLEREIIQKIGRKPLKQGPLTNKLVGGRFCEEEFKKRPLREVKKMKDRVRLALAEANCKPVYQINKQGVILNKFRSITDAAASSGIKISSICNALGDYVESKTSGGFIWAYADKYDETTEDERKDFIEKCLEKKDVCSKPIYQLDKDTKTIIKLWKSVTAAAMALTGRRTAVGGIAKAGKNGRNCQGFSWKYLDKGEENSIVEVIKT